jgi:multisubunit Na+/H+ antiporter MnhE subunit
MFSVTHFRSEFIQQGQANIIRKVTMTQFMLAIILTAVAIGLLSAPFWTAPAFVVIGYVAGYAYNGEIILKRVAAYLAVWLRNLAGAPQIVNVQAEWDSVRALAERQQIGGSFAATVVVE